MQPKVLAEPIHSLVKLDFYPTRLQSQHLSQLYDLETVGGMWMNSCVLFLCYEDLLFLASLLIDNLL